jgi:hypothetical protein
MQELGGIVKDTALEMKTMNDTQATVLSQAQGGNALVIQNSTSIQPNASNIEGIVDSIRAIDDRLQEYGTQINIQSNGIIDLKRDTETIQANLGNYSPAQDTQNILTSIVITSQNTNVIQRFS